MASMIGSAPNQVPTNGDLGGMAFQDPAAVSIKGGVANLNCLIVQDKRVANTNGQSVVVSGTSATVVREINTTVVNTIPGVSVLNNQIVSLPPGTYQIQGGVSNDWGANTYIKATQAKLYDVTHGVDLAYTLNAGTGSAGGPSVAKGIPNMFNTQFTLSEAATVDIRQLLAGSADATVLTVTANNLWVELYMNIVITQLATA